MTEGDIERLFDVGASPREVYDAIDLPPEDIERLIGVHASRHGAIASRPETASPALTWRPPTCGLLPRLESWLKMTGHPDTGPLGPVTTADLMDLIHQMTGWTGGPTEFTPPELRRVASITVSELRDFLIGASNALVNELDAPFADLLPHSDICALEHDIEEGNLREHVEMEYSERILDDMATP